MKTFHKITHVILVFVLFVITACSSDDSGDGPVNAASGTLVAKVDGTNYQSLEISSSATVANSGQNLIIIASNSDGNGFAITVIGYEGADRTYPIGGGSNIFNVASYTETDVDIANPQNSTTEIWQAPYDDTMVGEISITEETDTRISGTFNFMCKNVNGDGSVKNITEGSFNLNKQTN